MTPSLGSINLLGWLTELRKTVYLLDYQFIIKGYNRNNQMEDINWVRCGRKGTELPGYR